MRWITTLYNTHNYPITSTKTHWIITRKHVLDNYPISHTNMCWITTLYKTNKHALDNYPIPHTHNTHSYPIIAHSYPMAHTTTL